MSDVDQIAVMRARAVVYEHGEGVSSDRARAAALYCQATRLGDADSAFDIGWMYANGRGVDRDDALAAVFFRIAAEHGIDQAKNLLKVVNGPATAVPDCLRESAAHAVEGATTSIEAAPKPEPVTPPAPAVDPARLGAPALLFDMVQRTATEYGVSVLLVLAIIKAESNFNSAAVSAKNAQGLMQLIPQTAARFQVKDPFDPEQNIRGGVSYLRWLLAYFKGDVALVAAAYNAGERAVERHGGIPPYAETRAYVRRILSAVGSTAQAFDADVVEPSRLVQVRDRTALVPRLRRPEGPRGSRALDAPLDDLKTSFGGR